MKKILLALIVLLQLGKVQAQVTNIAPGEYKSIDIGWNGSGDYTRNLILLHEMYNGVPLDINYAIGTITAMRGHSDAFNRINVANINSSSSFTSVDAGLTSFDSYAAWKLKTCTYNGKKYLAIDVPYSAAYHTNGYKFTGWTRSTGENMKSVAYELNGQPVNQSVISNIEDYQPSISETHFMEKFVVFGNVGIGTDTPQEKLSVNGKIRAREIKVETANWPDYVFSKDYRLPDLKETETFIKTNGHLPGVPSAATAEKEGIELGEMNKILLKKIEELTLHLIELKKEVSELKKIK